MNNGYFVISLDFELMYGVSDLYSLNEYAEKITEARNTIPKILNLFDEYLISATWGVVGMLYNDDKNELLSNLPLKTPEYDNHKLSNYEYIELINDENEFAYFASDLIAEIAMHPNQELASHTYSHYYCNEPGQTLNDFEFDIKKAVEIAVDKGYERPVSIIFPRNMHNKSYKTALGNNGFKTFRGNPNNWLNLINKRFKLIIRLLRLIDSYVNITGCNCSRIIPDTVINIPASSFLRPASTIKIIEKLKLNRIKKQMRHAAKNKKVFHIWWHPHNFGTNTKENLDNLIEILDYYKFLSEKYDFKSANMKMLGEKFCENIDAGR